MTLTAERSRALETLKPEREQTIDEWAEENIILPAGVSSIPGPLSLEWSPFLRQPLRDATDPEVEVITACFSTQVGKTLLGILICLHSVAVRKRPAVHVMPRDKDARSISKERYQRIILATPALCGLLNPAKKKEMKQDSFTMQGIDCNFASAQSPSDLASRAVATLLTDETDKYPPWAGREADPLELARERTRTYWDRKVVETSTPTTNLKYIWSSLLESNYQRYFVPCPRCGEYQELVMGKKDAKTPGVKWPADVRDPNKIIDERLAWYRCEHCGGRIEDGDKQAMLRAGEWRAGRWREGTWEEVPGGSTRRHQGYHLWAAYSPWLTFSEIAAKLASCFKHQRAIPSKLMNFVNSWQALPWQQTTEELHDEVVKKAELGYRQEVVPEEATLLVATADVQSQGDQTYLFYVMRAYSGSASWLVKSGRLEGWEEFYKYLFQWEWKTATGRIVPVQFGLVDSGYRTNEVYQFCLRTGCIAVKGYQSAKSHQKVSQIAVGSDSVNLLTIDTTYYKDKLHRLIKEADAWHIPMDMPPEYFDHMTAEQKVQEVDKSTGRVRFVWRTIPEGIANHLLDCEVYQLAGVDLYQLAAVEGQAVPAAAKPPEPQRIIARVFT